MFGQPASQDVDLMSPCNTLDGWLKKKWKIRVINPLGELETKLFYSNASRQIL